MRKEMRSVLIATILLGSLVAVGVSEQGIMYCADVSPVLKISAHPDSSYMYSYDPQVGVDDAGNSYVVWHGNDGYSWEIYWVKIDADGVPGTVEMISTHPDNVGKQDWGPQIAVDGAGNSYVTWRCYDGYDNEIYWTKVDADGVPGTVEKVSTHPDNDTREDFDPQIAIDGAGNSYVTWRCRNLYNNDIYWVKIDADGVPGTVQMISTHADNATNDDFDPQISADSTGNSYVTWYGNDGNDDEIYWVKIDAASVLGTVQMISTHADNATNDDWYPQIATDSSGNSYITYQGYDGNDYEIYWVKVDTSGVLGTVEKVSTHLDNETRSDRYPQIAADGTGNSYVVYQGNDGTDNEIYWVKVDTGGVPGTVQMISTHEDNETGYDYVAQIAVDSSGNSYITYQGYDGRDDEVYWAKVDASGIAEPAEKVSIHDDNLSRDDWKPQIAADASGMSYITWQGWDGGDWEIYLAFVGDGDSDSDGIPDEEDKCPDEDPEGLDANLDGCKDVVCDLPDVVLSVGIENPGIENSLVSKAQNACDKFLREGIKATANQLDAFINQVEAQRGKHISEEDADMLIQFALNCQAALPEDTKGNQGKNPVTDDRKPGATNKQMRPLAKHNISQAQELSSEAEDLLSQAQEQGLDTSESESLIEAAEELLASALENFLNGNFIAANTLALEAAEAFTQALESLQDLLS